MADYDYDEGEVTPRERQAAEHQTSISRQNVYDIKNQLERQLANYTFADQQNQLLGNKQLKQNQRKTSADRFEAQRDLQSAALGLLGSMGSAMNGSSTGNLMRMLENRNDKDNATYWNQQQENKDTIENAYDEAINQNRVARRDAMQSAEKAVRDVESEWAAALNNINPNLFRQGAVNGEDNISSYRFWDNYIDQAPVNTPQLSGYVQPSVTGSTRNVYNQAGGTNERNLGAPRNSLQGNDYFSRLVNRFNGR